LLSLRFQPSVPQHKTEACPKKAWKSVCCVVCFPSPAVICFSRIQRYACDSGQHGQRICSPCFEANTLVQQSLYECGVLHFYRMHGCRHPGLKMFCSCDVCGEPCPNSVASAHVCRDVSNAPNSAYVLDHIFGQ
jgi:hypothetical protein